MTLMAPKPPASQVLKMAFKIPKEVKTGCLIRTLEKALAAMAGKTLREISGFQLVRAEEHMEAHIGMYKHLAVAIAMFDPANSKAIT